MISDRKRNRKIRTVIRNGLKAADMLWGDSFTRYHNISNYQAIHEEILDTIKFLGIMKVGQANIVEKLNDDRYSDKEKQLLFTRYSQNQAILAEYVI